MTCSPGDLVGIPFPFSDKKSQKRRPVLVVTSADSHGDFMGLAVTSVPTPHSAIPIDQEALETGLLPKQSWIRIDKIFTRLRQDAPCGRTGRNGDRRPRRSPQGEAGLASAEFRLASPQMPRAAARGASP